MYIVVLLITVGLAGCKTTENIPYNFNQPSSTIKLKKELNEISGLHCTSDTTVSGVQDEKATIQEVDSRTGDIRSTCDFGHDGDFEGISILRDSA